MNKKIEIFDKFPEWLYNYDDLTAEEKIFYMKIRSLAKDRGTWASNEYFSKLFKKDVRTINRYLAKMEKLGLIWRDTKTKQGYIKERMIYIKKTHDKDVISTNDKDVTGADDTDVTRTDDTDVTSTENNLTENYLTENKLTEEKPMSESKDSLAEAFEKLWKLYPNKKGKAPAFKAYKRAIKKGTTNKEIQDGIIKYKAEIQKRHTPIDKVAHGSTFFNQERWQDDYETDTPKIANDTYSSLGY